MKKSVVVVNSFIPEEIISNISTLLDSVEPAGDERGATDNSFDFYKEAYSHITNTVHKLPANGITSAMCPEVFSLLQPFIDSIGLEIERHFDCPVHPETHFAITVFMVGESLNPHYDGHTKPEEELLTPNHNPHRDISSVLYLNDNYTGGELEFIDLGLSLKPRPGTLVLFPGEKEYMHQVRVVESGKRYIIPQFWAKQ